jgi:radical SAM protein with 4Fe4S-binding SPASM domain
MEESTVKNQKQLIRLVEEMKLVKLTGSKTMCPLPWTHLAFEPSGRVIPCCLTSSEKDAYIGNLNTDRIESIWNSQNMKKLRKDMMNNIEPKICNKCFNVEKVTGESNRINHIRAFKDVLEKIPEITDSEGSCSEIKLKHWDFRFSNLCNFKCRSCGPSYSSAWIPDAKKLGWISNSEKVLNIESVDKKDNFEFLEQQIQYVESIYFAGGEPLLMPEHWKILELLIFNKRFNVRIFYNTNCSTLDYGKHNALDVWSKWEPNKIEISPSIDEIDERAELIRSGTVWSKVEENLKEISKLENIVVLPGLTIGAWNVFRLPEIITRLVEIGVVSSRHNYTNFFINFLEKPLHYRVDILPKDFKNQIIEKLQDFIKDFNIKYNTSIDDKFTYVLHELDKPFNDQESKKFIYKTNNIDKVRNENLFEIIPEMKVLLK